MGPGFRRRLAFRVWGVGLTDVELPNEEWVHGLWPMHGEYVSMTFIQLKSTDWAGLPEATGKLGVEPPGGKLDFVVRA